MIVVDRPNGLRRARRLRPGDAFKWASGLKEEVAVLHLVISSRLIKGEGQLEEEVTYTTGRELERQVTEAIVSYRIANVVVDG